MEKVDLKNWLKRYSRIKEIIDWLQGRLFDVEDRLEALGSAESGREWAEANDLEESRLELRARIEKLRIRGQKYRMEIAELIDRVEDIRYIKILEYKYLDCEDVDTIAELTGSTAVSVSQTYTKAIAAIPWPLQDDTQTPHPGK